MDVPSFEKLKAELDDACDFLRSFTLGKRGYTQRDGTAGVRRVTEVSDRLKAGFASGPSGLEATAAVAAARRCTEAAQARLALLKSQP